MIKLLSTDGNVRLRAIRIRFASGIMSKELHRFCNKVIFVCTLNLQMKPNEITVGAEKSSAPFNLELAESFRNARIPLHRRPCDYCGQEVRLQSQTEELSVTRTGN